MKKITLVFICILFFNIQLFSQWAQVNVPTSGFLTDIKFINSNVGYCLGQIGVLKTIDGGNNWSHISSSPSGRKIFFVNSSLGFVIDTDILYRTNDGGANWSQAYDFSASGETLRDVYFTTTNIGYIISSFYNNPAASFIYKTTNGGGSWTKTNTYTGMATAEGIDFVSKDTGFVVGYSGRVIKTYNAGASWTSNLLPGVETLFSVNFPSHTVGYAVGYSNFSGSEIVKTTDAGNTWQQLNANGIQNASLRSVYFHSVDTGYAAGDNGRIVRTFDGGSTWQLCTSTSTENLYSIYFTNAKVGFAVGNNGTLLKTINGGINGIRVNSQNTFNIFPNPAVNKISIVNDNNIVTKYALTLKSINGQEVLSKDIEFLNTYNLELEKLNNGVYFLTLSNDREQIVQKIIIQH